MIQNLPLDRDRRVQREATSLVAAGYRVTVICPRGTGAAPEGVTVSDHPAPPSGSGLLGYAVEFVWSFWWAAVRLAQLAVRDRLDVVQVCNPPDVYWPIGLVCRLFRRPFVYDHHDLSPELYAAKSGRAGGPVHAVLRLLERLTFATASGVVSTNESFRAVATGRGRVDPARVVVARNGPSLADLPPARDGARPGVPVVLYVGVMGPQDGVDRAVRAAALLKHELGRTGLRFVFVGSGDCLDDLRVLAAELDVDAEFTGWLEPDGVAAWLRAATVAIQPDPRNVLNEVSTMAKTVEYLAYGIPVVAADLRETRATAGDAAAYVPDSDPALLARALADLLDDPQRRDEMARTGRRRVVEALAWDHQAVQYVGLVNRLAAPRRASAVRALARSAR